MQSIALKIHMLLDWIAIKRNCFKDLITQNISPLPHAPLFIEQYLTKIQANIYNYQARLKSQRLKDFRDLVVSQDQEAVKIWNSILTEIRASIEVQSYKNKAKDVALSGRFMDQLQKDINYYQKLNLYVIKIAETTTSKQSIRSEKGYESERNYQTNIQKKYNPEKAYESDRSHNPINQNVYENPVSHKYNYHYHFKQPIDHGRNKFANHFISDKVQFKNASPYRKETIDGKIKKQLNQEMTQDLQKRSQKDDLHENKFTKRKRTFKYLDDADQYSKKGFQIENNKKPQKNSYNNQTANKSPAKLRTKQIQDIIATIKQQNQAKAVDIFNQSNMPQDSLDQRDLLKLSDFLDIKNNTPSTKQKTLQQLLTESMDSLRLEQRISLDIPDLLSPKQFIDYQDSLQMENTAYFNIQDPNFGIISSIHSEKHPLSQKSSSKELGFSFANKY